MNDRARADRRQQSRIERPAEADRKYSSKAVPYTVWSNSTFGQTIDNNLTATAIASTSRSVMLKVGINNGHLTTKGTHTEAIPHGYFSDERRCRTNSYSAR
jgi:hypothetical protein